MLTKETVERKWYVLDAAGKPLGKTAAVAADLLRGKLKTTYIPTSTAAITSSSSTPRTQSSPARSWSRSTTVPTPVIPAA